jgi:putative aldouronate transport system substrate-binding protein
MKKALAVILTLATIICIVSCGGKTGGKSANETVEITWWIPRGEDSTYYMSYDDNPAVRYLETMQFNGKNIDLKFTVPISGSERDNFNTLLMTEDYCKVFDMSYCTSSPEELVNDGIIWDLTPYMKEYMPHYMEIIENDPSLAPYVYNIVNGEKKVLSLYSITYEILGNFMGLNYRRDWVAKYGKNPFTGVAFTYGYTDPADYNTYYDDVVFPNGTSDPIYVSDWEWMFGIFEKAIADLGITDGYCISLYFKGYSEAGGNFASAFDGGTQMWFRDKSGNAAFNGSSEAMKTYIQMMNSWYKKGWLDKNFAEHTSDQVFAIDSAKINSGKIGAFIGRRGNTGGQMDNGDKLTKGIMIYGARPVINDVYGSDAMKYNEPYSLYQYSRLRGNLCISKKASEEDLKTILSMLDYLYTEEGGCLLAFGMTKEQNDVLQDPTYAKYNLTNGAFNREILADGSIAYHRDEKLLDDNDLASAMAAKRTAIGYYSKGFIPALNESYTKCALQAMAEWDYYYNTGYIDKALRNQFTSDEAATYSKVYANIDTYMSQNIPKFITGALDVNGVDWDNYVKMLNKYSPNKVTAIYQRVFDSVR